MAPSSEMDGDPGRFQDYAHRTEALLKSMEGDFLQAAADHQSEVGPKDGGDAPSVADAELVEIAVSFDKRGLRWAMELVGMWGMDDPRASETLASLAARVVTSAVNKAHRSGWFEEED